MNSRRCFSGKVTESDAFYLLPVTAQALYLHLCMQADDDGFVNNAKSVAARLRGGGKALKILLEGRFLLKFKDIYVIKHWRISNSLKNDRTRPLNYEAIAGKIWVKENRAYTDHSVEGSATLLEVRSGAKSGIQIGIQNGNIWNPKRTEENLTEENRREGKKVARAWERILELYPEGRIGKVEDAYAAFAQVDAGERKKMVKSLADWTASEQWREDEGRFVPYLVNWIQKGLWKVAPKTETVPKGASGNLGTAELEAIAMVLKDGRGET